MGDHEGDTDPVDAVKGVSARFSRDVAVNVVGNLLTIAVVYLVGAAAGVLPRSGALISAAIVNIVALVLGGAILAGMADLYPPRAEFRRLLRRPKR